MKAYFDTGVLLKIYVQESNSHEAIELVEKAGYPLLYTHLHAVEIATAIRLKRFRIEITEAQEQSALHNVKTDFLERRLQRPAYEVAEVFHRAEKLSADYAAKLGVRTLDTLHVAAALEIGCTAFVSFDERQRKLAKAVGLKVKP